MCFYSLFTFLLCNLLGPYYIKFKQLARCRDNGRDLIKYTTKVDKINRTHHSYTSNVTIGFDIDDEGMIHALATNKGPSGRWNSLLDTSMRSCEMIEKFAPKIVDNVFKASGKHFTCPIKKQTLVVKDFIMDFSTVTGAIPVFPYGDYRLEVSLNRPENGKQIRQACFSLFFEVRPLYEITPNTKAKSPFDILKIP